MKNKFIETYDEMGTTALHLATEHGHFEAARLLLEAGANPSKPEYYDGGCFTPIYGLTPLMIAVENGCIEMARLLLLFGANVEGHKLSMFRKPIFSAVINDDVALVKLLINYKANVHSLGVDGEKLFDCIPADSKVTKILYEYITDEYIAKDEPELLANTCDGTYDWPLE